VFVRVEQNSECMGMAWVYTQIFDTSDTHSVIHKKVEKIFHVSISDPNDKLKIKKKGIFKTRSWKTDFTAN
jgi:hypothetical protein